jgi:hypothetical protein
MSTLVLSSRAIGNLHTEKSADQPLATSTFFSIPCCSRLVARMRVQREDSSGRCQLNLKLGAALLCSAMGLAGAIEGKDVMVGPLDS